MNRVTKKQIAQFKQWVEADWPKDPMQQELHMIRLIRQEEMRGMTEEEILEYYAQAAKRTAA